jgi:hypothetical protein
MLQRPSHVAGWIAVLVACLGWCDSAAARQISCTKSGVAFDQAAYSAAYEIFCKKETVDEDSFDKLRATRPKNWQELIDFGQAFLPPNTVVDGSIMSSSKGQYGSVYMVTAIGAAHLSEPKFHLAIEAMTKANPLGVPGKVTWRSKESIADYTVDFYNQTFPESNVGGGPRECMGFIRYIHGTPPSHAQRVIGTYCEIGKHALDAARAAAVLKTVIVRPNAVE